MEKYRRTKRLPRIFYIHASVFIPRFEVDEKLCQLMMSNFELPTIPPHGHFILSTVLDSCATKKQLKFLTSIFS